METQKQKDPLSCLYQLREGKKMETQKWKDPLSPFVTKPGKITDDIQYFISSKTHEICRSYWNGHEMVDEKEKEE